MLGNIEDNVEIPFIVVAPRIPRYLKYQDSTNWIEIHELVIKMLDEVIQELPIDEDRIYLTGFSMGAFGT
ncbi:MAG TPA: hypothetical protein VIK72_10145 [Clostridiaceae bacterium]